MLDSSGIFNSSDYGTPVARKRLFDDIELKDFSKQPESSETSTPEVTTQEFTELNLNDFIKSDSQKDDDRPTYDSIMVKLSTGDIRMTDIDGKILDPGPRWSRLSLPKVMGKVFLQDPVNKRYLYDLAGNKYNWLSESGTQDFIINNWLIQNNNQRFYISKLYFNGITYEQSSKRSFEQIGFIAEDYVILYYNDSWHKLFYLEDYWESPFFNIVDIPKNDIIYMAEHGASQGFVDMIAELNGYDENDFPCKFNSMRSFIDDLDRNTLELVIRSFKYSDPQALEIIERVPSDVAVAIKNLTANRIRF